MKFVTIDLLFNIKYSKLHFSALKGTSAPSNKARKPSIHRNACDKWAPQEAPKINWNKRFLYDLHIFNLQTEMSCT